MYARRGSMPRCPNSTESAVWLKNRVWFQYATSGLRFTIPMGSEPAMKRPVRTRMSRVVWRAGEKPTLARLGDFLSKTGRCPSHQSHAQKCHDRRGKSSPSTAKPPTQPYSSKQRIYAKSEGQNAHHSRLIHRRTSHDVTWCIGIQNHDEHDRCDHSDDKTTR